MKKVLIFCLIIFGFCSCKKDYLCQCTDTSVNSNNGQSSSATYNELITDKEEDAKAKCTLKNGIIADPSGEEVTTTTCALLN